METKMAKFSEKKVKKGAEKGVRMFPNNGLKQPVRPYSSTFSAVTVLKQMYLQALMASDSKGGYLNKFIVGKHKSMKVRG